MSEIDDDDENEIFDHSEVDITWEGERPSADTIARVRADIKDELTSLSRPSDLAFHIVFLSEKADGPTVTLFGRADNTFGAEYTEHTEWTPLSELVDQDD